MMGVVYTEKKDAVTILAPEGPGESDKSEGSWKRGNEGAEWRDKDSGHTI